MDKLSSNPLTSAQVVAICKHTLQCINNTGRIITLKCPVCRYELNVLADHLRAESPRLQLDDEQHSKASAAFDQAWNSIAAIAGTLQLLASGEVSLAYVQGEVIDRIGRLGSYRDALEKLRDLLDLPESAPLTAEDRDDWQSPDTPFTRPVGEKTEELDEIDDDTEERQAVHVNIYTDPAASRSKLQLEESEAAR